MKKINVPELELKILKIMWDLKVPSSVQEIINRWIGDSIPGYTTVLKKLQVMEGKRFVDHKKNGRSYNYFTLIEKSDVSQTKFNSLLSDLFGGDKLEMATAFVKDTGLTKGEIDSLMAILEKGKGDD